MNVHQTPVSSAMEQDEAAMQRWLLMQALHEAESDLEQQQDVSMQALHEAELDLQQQVPTQCF